MGLSTFEGYPKGWAALRYGMKENSCDGAVDGLRMVSGSDCWGCAMVAMAYGTAGRRENKAGVLESLGKENRLWKQVVSKWNILATVCRYSDALTVSQHSAMNVTCDFYRVN